jgi:transcriptional regulator with PAS, ATPase and Fis domain
MKEFEWLQNYNAAVTVCDLNGIVLFMNNKAGKTFEKWGGLDLIGKCLFDCHQPRSVEMMKQMMQNNSTNTYTIEKNGVKKLIYQTPWTKNDQVAGMVEISIEIPFEMPHFIRS